jgi:hypothetical protein
MHVYFNLVNRGETIRDQDGSKSPTFTMQKARR